MRPEDVDAGLVEKAADAMAAAYDEITQDEISSMHQIEARVALAAVIPEIQAQALRDHRKRVVRFYSNASLLSKATVLADLDDYADRLTATTEEPTTAIQRLAREKGWKP